MATTVLTFLEEAIPAARAALSNVTDKDVDGHQNFVLSMLHVLLGYADTALNAWRCEVLLAIPLIARSTLETHVELLLTINDPAYYFEIKERQAKENAAATSALSRCTPDGSSVSEDWPALRDMLRQVIQDRNESWRSIQKRFNDVGFQEIYDTFYRRLSTYTHPSLTLMRDIRNGAVYSKDYHQLFIRRIAKDVWHATNQAFIFCGYPVLRYSKDFVLLKLTYQKAMDQPPK